MIDNYDATTKEPEVLPRRVPNLLINRFKWYRRRYWRQIIPPIIPVEVIKALKAVLAKPDLELR